MSDPVLEDTGKIQENLKILTHNINLRQEDNFISPRDLLHGSARTGEYIESNRT